MGGGLKELADGQDQAGTRGLHSSSGGSGGLKDGIWKGRVFFFNSNHILSEPREAESEGPQAFCSL